ncbi:hypothetical protein [Gemmatimonas phototrophica]|uniref:Uncharacterized protein n=1 Tax=Gemmatimonas phototrophica TaxID=1379270 RepID=A0A143BKZ4_9BACT|nr:hypothetical protein [Gemmatimonas phototrophica]AMW05709.1 hypothetical protein GEMMAAP_14685 [Gemmatimonas phototrophica]
MTFTQQVQHVVRFDLRRTAIWWMLYLALLAITPFAMFGQPLYHSLPALSRMFLPLLTWCVGMGLAVIVVQADSPLSPTAFWKGKPLEERAFGTAKLVVLGLIVLAATITAVIVWRAMDMPPRLIVPTLRQAVPAYLIPVLFTAIFGAVTRSLARALLLSVGFLMLMFLLVPAVFLSTGMPNAAVGLTTSAWTNASGSVLLCSSLALVFLYSWRRVNHVRPIWLVATALLLGTVATVSQFFAVLSGTRSPSIAYAGRTLVRVTADAPASMTESVRFDSIPQGQKVGGRVPFTITEARGDRRYELQQLRLTPFDGRGIGGPSITLTTTPLAVSPEALTMPATAGWSTDEPMATSLTPDRGLIYGDWRVSETLDTVRSISLEGVVVRYRAERIKVVPFALGPVYGDSAVSIQLTEGRNGLLELAWTSFYNAPDRNGLAGGTSPLYREFAFAVIDSGQQTVRLLGSSNEYGATEWMVLPGAFRWVTSNQLDYQPALRAMLGARGSHNASLAVYRWVEDGRRRVRQITGVDDWPRRPPRREVRRALGTGAP